jgi:hypothetical protein
LKKSLLNKFEILKRFKGVLFLGIVQKATYRPIPAQKLIPPVAGQGIHPKPVSDDGEGLLSD